jgi:membrane-associated protease RseP (regulator of RpoE activity)
MVKNVGKTDKMIRIVAGIILIALDYFEVVTGSFSWILSVVAVILIATAFLNFCPILQLLGKNTCEIENK